ncbi:MAG: hypothetical protein DIU68_010495 [Chloroflexota bacterium]|nr:MAG: hypothetical protein DIU68_01945 [Chloroflexota bacterium]
MGLPVVAGYPAARQLPERLPAPAAAHLQLTGILFALLCTLAFSLMMVMHALDTAQAAPRPAIDLQTARPLEQIRGWEFEHCQVSTYYGSRVMYYTCVLDDPFVHQVVYAENDRGVQAITLHTDWLSLHDLLDWWGFPDETIRRGRNLFALRWQLGATCVATDASGLPGSGVTRIDLWNVGDPSPVTPHRSREGHPESSC